MAKLDDVSLRENCSCWWMKSHAYTAGGATCNLRELAGIHVDNGKIYMHACVGYGGGRRS
jgi:hypothetical protein